MKLQVAMDLPSTEAALALAGKVAEYVDIIELGTPLIKKEGQAVVAAMKKAHPDKLIFADMKIMDTGELEADMAFDAGADIVSVLAVSNDDTVKGAVTSARKHGRKICADPIGVPDKAKRLSELEKLGVDMVELHAGLDEQAQEGYSIENLLEVGRNSKLDFAVAGGVNLERIESVEKSGAAVAVCGGSIYNAKDPGDMARQLRAKIKTLG